LAGFLALLVPASAEKWHPAKAPLTTRWAADVSPEKARPEYPRPQFARNQWRNLNGLWELGFDDQNNGEKADWTTGHSFPERILVPFTFESSLSGLGLGTEVHDRLWYRRHFTVPPKWRAGRLLLNFGACDWQTTVWVNGKRVGEHRGGYTPFTFEITRALVPGERQELVVSVYDPQTGPQPKGKQLGSRGIWYTRTTGIWQTVWLEPVPVTYLKSLVLGPKPEERALLIDGRVAEPSQDTELKAVLSLGGHEVATGVGRVLADGSATVSLALVDVRQWSPEEPTLYDLKLEVIDGGHRVDEVTSYCGFRTVGVKRGRMTLNGQPVFLRGVLDQGFWPDGIYTAPTDEALRYDVEMAKALGFNLARKHVKVEDPRWYYWCDRLGLLVAQDMPSSHDLSTPEAREQFLREWSDAMTTVRNHPSVALWIPFNEDWGSPGAFQDRVVTRTRGLDPTRPIIDNSGGTQRALTDVMDVHDYSSRLAGHTSAASERPLWVGEFGGIGLPVRGHTWTEGWGYQAALGPRSLLSRYSGLVRQLYQAHGLSGFVYTQLADVEQELNGLLTYDRIPKADPATLSSLTNGNPLPPIR
jgi:beta-galactosidase/beta-glucuronidase